jgi:hypothetical protein
VKAASSVVSHRVATSLVSGRTIGGKINRLAGPKVRHPFSFSLSSSLSLSLPLFSLTLSHPHSHFLTHSSATQFKRHDACGDCTSHHGLASGSGQGEGITMTRIQTQRVCVGKREMRHEVLLSFSLFLILSPSPPLSLQHVPLTEFLHKRFMKPDTSPMLKRVVQLSLRISRMVMMEVLRLPELPARTAMFEHILCVAQCLKDLNNFEGVCVRERDTERLKKAERM